MDEFLSSGARLPGDQTVYRVCRTKSQRKAKWKAFVLRERDNGELSVGTTEESALLMIDEPFGVLAILAGDVQAVPHGCGACNRRLEVLTSPGEDGHAGIWGLPSFLPPDF